MQPIRIVPSLDRQQATLSAGNASVTMSATEIDALIRDLASVRAQMIPIHPAEPPDDSKRVHQSDNLLWTVKAAPHRAVIQFGTQHPGLGWTVMWLSRAQVEDLQTSLEFELVKIPGSR
jgi:hypothetical protein